MALHELEGNVQRFKLCAALQMSILGMPVIYYGEEVARAIVHVLAAPRGVITVIDNTFATPILQNPLELGFDLVMHSGTKYLAGHSDLICGAVSGAREFIDRVRDYSVNHGGCLNAQDCHLLERSLKTLELRVRRQSEPCNPANGRRPPAKRNQNA